MAKDKRLSHEEVEAQRKEWQRFVNRFRRTTGGTTNEAHKAWKEHLIAQETERRTAQSQKLKNLYHDPAFKKYLRGW